MPRRATLLTLGLAAYPPIRHGLRRVARAFMRGLFRIRSRPLDLGEGTALFVAPHQDDATLGCGGLIHARRSAGHDVHILYLTDGAASHPDHPRLKPGDIAQLRRREAALAMSRLGVARQHVHFLDLPDGRLPHLADAELRQASQRVTELCDEVGPRFVFLPYRFDGSSEHEAGFTLVLNGLGAARAHPRMIEYPVWALWSVSLLVRPWLQTSHIYRFSGRADHQAVKRHAIAAFASQLSPTPPWTEPVLPAGFALAFSGDTEFFFESP